jgi:hypothetical protein
MTYFKTTFSENSKTKTAFFTTMHEIGNIVYCAERNKFSHKEIKKSNIKKVEVIKI